MVLLPQDDLIHAEFGRQAARDPSAVAIVDGEHRISYGLLDSVSDGIANRLAAEAIGPGDIVAVMLRPSGLLIATLLGVLKRGAAYAVVEASWPAERLRYVAKLCCPTAIVGQEGDAGVFSRTWTPGADLEAIADGPQTPPVIPVRGPDPAMVFFTSGTTGDPKAVLSPHQATIRLVRDCAFARLDTSTVMPQAAPAPWDAFALEVWGPLLTGGTCVLPDERPITPAGLRGMIVGHAVNTLFLTTSLFHLFVDEDLAAFSGLRTVIVGGEALSPVHAARFLAGHPDIRLVNGYGPVESTVFALCHEVRPDDARGNIPIGRPVRRTRVAVMAGDRQCVAGEVGEICIAGDGLAVGYLGDPELTAAKFVRFSVDGEDVRWYRTGDLGSVSTDGIFQFAGRVDRQLKVRGHRIEPAAIERVAGQVPAVLRAVVVPIHGPTGNCESLVLFFRCDTAGPSGDELIAAMREHLPSYSMPDLACAVTQFPLSANGKLDNERMLTMARGELGTAGAGRTPALVHSVPDIVAMEFESVLGGETVHRDRSFFALGGTSLGAIRLCTRLGAAFDRAVPVSQLMRTPTVAGLAAWLAAPSGVSLAHADEIEEQTEQTPLTPAQIPFLLRHFDNDADIENHCLLVWEVNGTVHRGALAAAVEDVHQRHRYLRSRYELVEDALAVLSTAPSQFHLTSARGDDAARALLRDLLRPFDLANGEVWRSVLVDVDHSGRWLFGINVHHIAFDGWSEHLLVNDLGVAYAARSRGAAPIFAESAPGPAAHRGLDGLDAGANLSAQRRHWAQTLAGLPELDLPTPQRPVGDLPGVDVVMPPGQLDRLDQAAGRLGTGRLTVLLIALGDTLLEVTGQKDFGVGVPVTQRSTAASKRIVGCLINTVCVRLRPAELGAAAATTSAVGAALANSDLPFADVVRLSGVRRRTGRDPLYQVMAAIQDSPEPDLRLGDAIVRPHQLGTVQPPPTELAVELIVTGQPRVRVRANGTRVGHDVLTAVASGLCRRLFSQ